MNGVHDMGGMHGFGPVRPEKSETVFHEPWEGRAFGMFLGTLQHRLHAPHGMRFALESMDPAAYLRSSYYERWLSILEQAAVRHGVVTSEELENAAVRFMQQPDAAVATRIDPDAAKAALEAVFERQPARPEEGGSPRFQVGDRVRARNINPRGHTRLPRYVRGRQGVVDRLHRSQKLQDMDTESLNPGPQAVYCVRFEGAELWGPAAEPRGSLYIDMWESYLEPA